MEAGYQVIARRWRPKQFDELVGQDYIVRTLKNAISGKRIAHAYMLVGPRGTGKTSTARLFAKALNCEQGPTVTPCNQCPSCEEITAGNSLDVIEIDGASNNSVEQVRELREDCQYAPTRGRYKIYIIDEVHMLSNAAFNALLKTLEEPPSHVIFIFATTEARKVLATIVSRCQRFAFRPIADSVIAEKLSSIAQTENISVEDEALQTIARLANGGMRDAQSILDQMISFCGDAIKEQDVLDVYGLAPPKVVESLLKAVAAADYNKIIDHVEELDREGRDLYRALLDLQDLTRQALLEAVRQNGSTSSLGRPLRAEELMRMLEALRDKEHSVKMGLSEKVNFEVALLSAVEASRARAIDSLIREISGLAKELPEPEGSPKKKVAQAEPSANPEPSSYNQPQSKEEEEKEKDTEQPTEQEIVNESIAEELMVEEPPLSSSAAASAPSTSNEELVLPETQPELESLVAKIPQSTKKFIEEQLRGHFREVQKIDTAKLI